MQRRPIRPTVVLYLVSLNLYAFAVSYRLHSEDSLSGQSDGIKSTGTPEAIINRNNPE